MAKQSPKKTNLSQAGKDLLTFVGTDKYAERLTAIVHKGVREGIASTEVDVFNGGEVLVKKSLLQAITAISMDVREVRNNLEENTKQTAENTKYLAGAKERSELWESATSFWGRWAKAFKLKLVWKVALGLLIIYAAYHGKTDIPKGMNAVGEFIGSVIKSL